MSVCAAADTANTKRRGTCRRHGDTSITERDSPLSEDDDYCKVNLTFSAVAVNIQGRSFCRRCRHGSDISLPLLAAVKNVEIPCSPSMKRALKRSLTQELVGCSERSSFVDVSGTVLVPEAKIVCCISCSWLDARESRR